jgi:hypothetical protein
MVFFIAGVVCSIDSSEGCCNHRSIRGTSMTAKDRVNLVDGSERV